MGCVALGQPSSSSGKVVKRHFRRGGTEEGRKEGRKDGFEEGCAQFALHSTNSQPQTADAVGPRDKRNREIQGENSFHHYCRCARAPEAIVNQ